MAEKPVLISSDSHLGAVDTEREAAFVAWLEHAATRASRVVLNGDIFDFWFEYRHAIPRGHTRVLGALARIVDAGVPVLLMGGNHDWWGGSYLREEVGLELHHEPIVLDLVGHRTFLAHGDGLGRGDLGYRILRLVLRGRLTRWLFRWLHPDLGAGVAWLISQTASHGEGPSHAEDKRARCLREWAVTKLSEDPSLDLVVLGHSHVPVVEEARPGCFYVNAGDWIHHNSFVVLERDAPPRLERWWEGGPVPLDK